MKTSDKIKAAFDNCLQFGDSEEMEGLLDSDFVRAEYLAWDEFDPSEFNDALPDERQYDLGALLLAGAECQKKAQAESQEAFVLPDDGNGTWIFYALNEATVITELLRVGAFMEAQTTGMQP